jgi:hypothetical protein
MLIASGCMSTGNHYARLVSQRALHLFMITDVPSYPRWILPDPVEPEKVGDYEDEDDD